MYPRMHLKLTLFITLKSRKCIVFLNFTGSFTQAQHTIFFFFLHGHVKVHQQKGFLSYSCTFSCFTNFINGYLLIFKWGLPFIWKQSLKAFRWAVAMRDLPVPFTPVSLSLFGSVILSMRCPSLTSTLKDRPSTEQLSDITTSCLFVKYVLEEQKEVRANVWYEAVLCFSTSCFSTALNHRQCHQCTKLSFMHRLATKTNINKGLKNPQSSLFQFERVMHIS